MIELYDNTWRKTIEINWKISTLFITKDLDVEWLTELNGDWADLRELIRKNNAEFRKEIPKLAPY